MVASNSEGVTEEPLEPHDVRLQSGGNSQFSYQRVNGGESQSEMDVANESEAERTLCNFVIMSVLFSANHGCVVACLALATARLGATGAWQGGILYLTYTASALLGATYIVKRAGARNSLLYGMTLYCAYVGCFWVAVSVDANTGQQRTAAWTGAAIGGIGAGFLWTAQGAYFTKAAEEHSRWKRQPVTASTASFAGYFAFAYLAEEVALRLLSSLLAGYVTWKGIFGLYTIVAVASTMAMPLVYNYPQDTSGDGNDGSDTAISIFYKITVAGQLLIRDPKMKYMIGLNAVFGFASAFLNSYVNGEVVPIALNDPDSRYIGLLSSWVSAVAAGMSLVFGRVASVKGKGPILVFGATCFLGVALAFVIQPNARAHGWISLLVVYTLHGTGRATFEGTLKATFADFFGYEKEGAFANIIFQNGLSGAVGYVLTFSLHCTSPSRYCVEYGNGTLHDVLSFELLVVVAAVAGILGYWKAANLQHSSQHLEHDRGEAVLGTEEAPESFLDRLQQPE